MNSIILIKHAAPVLTPDVPSDRWVLSATGQESCRWLANDLRGRGLRRVYSSLEPKALETAARLSMETGTDVRPRADLHENDRTSLGFGASGEFEHTIARFFDEPDTLVMGQETAHAALARFDAAIRSIVTESGDAPVAVVAHGTVITLFLAERSDIRPFTIWRQLGLACWVLVEGPDLRWDGLIHGPPH